MGQSTPIRPIAVIVEDDKDQRDLVAALLEESEMSAIECESAEAAVLILKHFGEAVTFLFVDVRLAGSMSGVELARRAKEQNPHLSIVITSGSACPGLPRGTKFMQKPWRALDVLIEAERSVAHARA
jgi:FixJ family two-component response regulator